MWPETADKSVLARTMAESDGRKKKTEKKKSKTRVRSHVYVYIIIIHTPYWQRIISSLESILL